MKRGIMIFVGTVLISAGLTQMKVYQYFKGNPTESSTASPEKDASADTFEYSANDPIYRWDEILRYWVAIDEDEMVQGKLVASTRKVKAMSEPIEVDWQVLIDIKYKLKYFEEIDMEVYAPVFSKAVKALDGKEVLIKGFVIPFDKSGELLALSANPFASCFFCGKASPASVVSMHLRDKGKRYKMDDFKLFRGQLKLNYDDPDEYYYILRDAREE